MTEDLQTLGRLHELSLLCTQKPEDLRALLAKALDAAIAVSEADFGCIQLVDPVTSNLVITEQRGLPEWWIEFWDRQVQGQGACGAVLRNRARLIAEDVRESPIFAGPALDIQLRAGVLAVQSTPLMTASGKVVGVLSTHFRAPRRLENATLAWLDLLARQTADLIDSAHSAQPLRQSETRKTARQLAAERLRLEALLQALPVGVAFTDTPGCEHMTGNAALLEMFEIRAEDNVSATASDPNDVGPRIVYRRGAEVVPAGDLPMQRAARDLVRVGPVELEVGLPGGRNFFVDVTAAPILGTGGAVAVVADVTAKKRAEAALAQMRAKDEFLAELSHELRNPLAAIATAVDGSQEGDTPNAWEPTKALIRRQAEVLMRLSEDLADLSRVANGQLRLNVGAVSLHDLMHAAAATAAPATAKRKQIVVVRTPDEDVQFRGDRVRLLQIVVNLLDNASKYSGVGALVELEGELEGGDVVLRCKDNGDGIDAQMLERIFEPFVRAPYAGAVAPGGFGLGLALIQRLVELHGGTVKAESHGNGSGSTFVVRMPFVAAPQEPGAKNREVAPPPAEASSAASAPLRVLLVEDHPEVSTATAGLLLRQGMQVTIAPNGKSALDAALQTRPQLLLCDLGLPDMSGLELVGMLRQSLAAWGTHVVVLTGRSPSELAVFARHATGLGIDEFIAKPLKAEWLQALQGRMRGN